MKMKILLISIFSALLLASCAETPDNVISKAEEKQNEQQTAIYDAKPESIPVDDLEEDVANALSATYSNFVLANGINVDLPEAYTECDFIQVDGFSEKADEMVGRFFDSEMIEGVEIEDHADNIYTDSYIAISRGFRDENKEIHYYVWDDGFICFIKPLLFEEQINGGPCVKLYHVDRNDDLSDKYLLGDKEVSVKEAVDAANNWLKENYADIEPDYDIEVKTVIARQNDYGEYSLHFNIHKIYKGIELDELLTTLEDVRSHKIKYATQRIVMVMKNGTDIDYFTNGNGMVKPIEKQPLNEIISLSSALRSIEFTFADFEEKPTINDINLKYTMTPQYDPELDPYNAPNTEMTGRIVWEFVIDVPHESLAYPGDSGDIRRFIYVDAENGEIDYEFDIFHIKQ